jgi:drug/metabolite transporter (DMT)-like permease
MYNSPIASKLDPLDRTHPRPVLMPKAVIYLKALAASLIWGTSFVASKIVLQEVHPATLTWTRFSIGVLVLGSAVVLRKQFVVPPKKEWGFFVLFGFLGIAFHQWLQANGMVTSAASTTSWIVATTPIFFAIFAWPILKERVSPLAMLGIALAAVGVLLVISKGDWQALSLGQFGQPGDFLILISAPNWAIFSIYSRRGMQSHPAALMIFWLMLIGVAFTSVLFFTGSGPAELAQLSVRGWSAAVYLGVFCSGLAYIFWYDALSALSATQTGAFLYLEPISTVIVAALLLDEKITPASMLGGAIILFGVYLVNNSGRQPAAALATSKKP